MQMPAAGYGATAAQPGAYPQQQSIPNYLAHSVVITICSAVCCGNVFGMIFGIVAIVFSAQVNGKLQSGDVNGAMESSRKAKTWCWVAAIVSIVLTIITLIVLFSIGVLAGVMKQAGVN